MFAKCKKTTHYPWVILLKKSYPERIELRYNHKGTAGIPIQGNKTYERCNRRAFLITYMKKNLHFCNLKKKRITNGPTDRRTDRRTDGRTDPLIEMRGRI